MKGCKVGKVKGRKAETEKESKYLCYSVRAEMGRKTEVGKGNKGKGRGGEGKEGERE